MKLINTVSFVKNCPSNELYKSFILLNVWIQCFQAGELREMSGEESECFNALQKFTHRMAYGKPFIGACTWMSYIYIFIFIHHKGSDKNNNNSKEKQNNLAKQRNRVTCKFLNEFLIPFYQQYTRQLTTKHSLTVMYYFYIRCPKQLHEKSVQGKVE